MGRGLSFVPSEDDFLIANAEKKTAQELIALHDEMRKDMMWPERSLKSLARRVERLRDRGQLGIRTDEARRKAYYGRNQNLRGE